jgi:hypothetical protein
MSDDEDVRKSNQFKAKHLFHSVGMIKELRSLSLSSTNPKAPYNHLSGTDYSSHIIHRLEAVNAQERWHTCSMDIGCCC